MRTGRLLRYVFLGTLFVVLLVVATGLLLLDSRWGTERVRRLIVSRANGALAGTLSIQSMSGSLIGGDVRLVGVALVQEGIDVFRADEVQLRYSLPQMMSGLDVADVVITRPRVAVVQDPESRAWNVAHLTRGGGGGGRPTLAIRRLQVINGDVEIRPVEAAAQHVASLDTTLGLRMNRDAVRLEVSTLSARDGHTGVAVRRMRGDLTLAGGAITVTDLNLATDASAITGTVETRPRPDPSEGGAGRTVTFDVVTSPLQLKELAAYVPALATYPASAAVRVKARGSLEGFTAEWTLESSAGRGAGSVKGASTGEALILMGDVDAEQFKVREWFHNDTLPDVVDVTSTYELRLPWKDWDALRVQFDGAVPRVIVADYDLRQIRAKGAYERGTVSARGSLAAYGVAVAGLGRWNKDTRAWSGEGAFQHLDLRRLPSQTRAPSLASDLNGRAKFEGGRRDWSVDAVLAPSTVEGAAIADGFLASAGSRAGTMTYAARGSVKQLDPQRLTAVVDNPPDLWRRARGHIDADLTVEGSGTTLASTRLTADVWLDRATLPGIGLDDARLQATLDRSSLTLDLESRAMAVTDDPLGYQTGPINAVGVGRAHVTFADVSREIRFEDLTGNAAFQLTKFEARSIGLDRVDVVASASGGTLSLSRFETEGRDVNVRATGDLAVAGVGASALTFTASLGDLTKLTPFTGHNVAGGAVVEGKVTGTATRPVVTGTIKARELAYESATALSLTGQFDAAVPDFKFERAAGTFEAATSFVDVSGTRLDEIQTRARFDAGRLDLEATIAQGTREFNLAGLLVPHPDHREVHLRRATFTAGNTTWQLRSGQEAVVQYATKSLRIIGLSLVSGTATLDVKGAVGDAATEPLTVIARGVAVEDLNQMALGTRDLRGRIDADVTVSGAMDALVVSGKATVVDGQVEGLPFQRLQAGVGYRDRTVTLDVVLDAGTLGRLTAAGRLPYAGNAPAGTALVPYDLTIQSSTLDLGFFQPLTSYVQNLRGTAQIDVRMRGAANAPSFDGTVSVANGTFLVSDTGITYSALEADLALAGQQLTVKRFRLVDDDGHPATIEGSLNVPGLAADNSFELIIATRELHLMDNQFGEVAVTTDLQALGTLDTPLVSGTIRVNRGRLEVSDLLDRLASSGYRATPDATAPAGSAGVGAPAGNAYTRSSLSITLDLPGNVVVRGRDLRTRGGPIGFGDINVTIGGALSIAKESNAEPVLLGRVDVVRGQYQFQGRQFAIVRGSELRFQGSPTDPALDVTAERDISGVTAEVRVTGTLSRPEIQLSSSPPLDQGDVLALIVFNQPMNALPGSERVSLAARAGAMAAGAIATPLADSVARALDLDLFEIRPSESAGGGASVRIGRQVSDRLFLGFSQDFGREELSELSFEVRLNRIISVVTSIAHGSGADYGQRRAQQAGIDLIFMVR